MTARVVGLYTAAHAGAPMESRAWVELLPGVGIIGDRYATRRGYWSDPKWSDQELTLVESEVATDLNIEAERLRRNVVTAGIQLDDLIGVTFQIGDVSLVGVRRCDPCGYLESCTRPGLARALASRGGLRARILQEGRIQLGDPIVVLSSPSACPH